MSIWSYITDVELQRLREANAAIGSAQAELEKITRAQQETSQRMYAADNAMRKYQAMIVARAVGDSSVPLLPTPETAEQLRVVLAALEHHWKMRKQDVDFAHGRFRVLKSATLKACMARAAERYCEQADELAETWQQINTALAASETPSLSWRQVFIPALEGMRGANESHSRPALFSSAQPNVSEMENELVGLLG